MIVSNATVGWETTPTLWPLWNDAILVSSFGLMRSVAAGNVNATDDLLIASCATSPLRCNSSLDVAIAQPDAVLSAARSVFSSLPSTIESVFTMTLTGPSLVSIVGSPF